MFVAGSVNCNSPVGVGGVMYANDTGLQRLGTDIIFTDASLGLLQCRKAIGTVVVAGGHAGPGVGPVCHCSVGTISCIVELGTRDTGGCQYQDESSGN